MQLVRLDDPSDERRWNSYVEPRTSTITDLFEWRHIVFAAYRIRSHFFGTISGGDLTGVLGLFEIKHPIFGHYLTTAPFGNDGGLIADDPEAIDPLMAEAGKLADQLNVDYLVIRTRRPIPSDLAVDQRYCTAIVDLSLGTEHLWKHVLPSKTRNQVRKGKREGFSVSMGRNEIRSFHKVFHAHMRNLGSPAHSMRFYRLIETYLAERAHFIVVRDGNTVVAGALLFHVNGTAVNLHTVSLHAYNRRCPNYLLYWHMLNVACDLGCTSFDMGRSLKSGSNLDFKKNWNPQVVPLVYAYGLRRSKNIPFQDPRNMRYRLPIAIWKRLPLFVTEAAGPRLISGLA